MTHIDHEPLVTWSAALLAAVGAPADVAQTVSTSLVEANLRGHDSHGVRRLPLYIGRIRSGHFDPAARPTVRRRGGSSAQVDGGGGFGQLGAQLCCRIVAELAAEQGLATVALINTQHIGRLGEYAEYLAERDLLTLVLTTGGSGVAPFGGRGKVFGTNPMAWGIPAGPATPPIVSDFSTSAVAEGKVAVTLAKGEQLPPGSILDAHGNPSTNPQDFYEGGVLLPFGGHKGYALSLMTQIAAGMLTGNVESPHENPTRGNPTLFTVWSTDLFADRSVYHQQVQALCAKVKATEPVAGVDEVMLPGEPERRSLAVRHANGIPLPDSLWREMLELSRELEVAVPGAGAEAG